MIGLGVLFLKALIGVTVIRVNAFHFSNSTSEKNIQV